MLKALLSNVVKFLDKVEERKTMSSSVQALIDGITVNSRLTADASVSGVKAAQSVVDAFARLKQLLSNDGMDQAKVEEARQLINASNDQMVSIQDTFNKIAETAQASAPTQPTDLESTDPSVPVVIEEPSTEPSTDPSTEIVVDESGELPIDIFPSPEDLGLEGAVIIDPEDSSTGEESELVDDSDLIGLE